MKKSAVIFGSTGLVGSFLLEALLQDDRYGEVKIFVRKPTGIKHHKIEEIVIDFNKLDDYRKLVKGDEVFNCMGTTIKTAGSQEKFRQVDYEFVRWTAVCAKENGVKSFLVVSSLGATTDTANFYLRTKGEMEKAVSALGFEKCVIVRPSMLRGPRKEFRLGERIGQFVMGLFYFITPAKYKAIHVRTVAKAMIAAANDDQLNGVLESDVLRRVGKV